MHVGWSDSKIQLLGEMIDQGWTSPRAARELKITRSAAIARARRLGWRFGVARTDEQRAAPIPKRGRGGVPKRAPDWRPNLKTSDCFDPETGDQIKAYARAQGCSICQAVRELVEFGLETWEEAREDDVHEGARRGLV